MVKSLRAQCIELLTEIEARLDFDDEMPPLDCNLVIDKIHTMLQQVNYALETANYDKLLQSGVQVLYRKKYFNYLFYAVRVDLYIHNHVLQCCRSVFRLRLLADQMLENRAFLMHGAKYVSEAYLPSLNFAVVSFLLIVYSYIHFSIE